jgi:hypothetical protein
MAASWHRVGADDEGRRVTTAAHAMAGVKRHFLLPCGKRLWLSVSCITHGLELVRLSTEYGGVDSQSTYPPSLDVPPRTQLHPAPLISRACYRFPLFPFPSPSSSANRAWCNIVPFVS